MKKIETVEAFKAHQQEENVVYMFSATWCPDCVVLYPVLDDIEAECADFTFYSVDRDEFIDQCIELDIFGIPSFVTFNKGQETGRLVNKNRKTKEEVVNFIQSTKE